MVLEHLSEPVDVTLSVIALVSAVLGWFRWIRPRLRARLERQRSIDEVLLGRDAIPANSITGAAAQPAKPSIGQQVTAQAEMLDALGKLVAEIHHELHPNGGSSMKDGQARLEGAVAKLLDEVALMKRRLERGDHRFDDVAGRLGRIEGVLADELRTAQQVAVTATDAVGHAAEASKAALETIHDAILADPPPDIS